MHKRLAGMATSWRARLMGVLAALAMAAGLLAVTAAPASASTMACHYDFGIFNACLTIDLVDDHKYDVHVGIDLYMYQWAAEEILACPGRGYFYAELWGDDGGPGDDDYLGTIPLLTGWPRSGSNPAGIFAEFARPKMNLNEDDGRDEVYAKVAFYHCLTGAWNFYLTGKHVGNFD